MAYCVAEAAPPAETSPQNLIRSHSQVRPHNPIFRRADVPVVVSASADTTATSASGGIAANWLALSLTGGDVGHAAFSLTITTAISHLAASPLSTSGVHCNCTTEGSLGTSPPSPPPPPPPGQLAAHDVIIDLGEGFVMRLMTASHLAVRSSQRDDTPAAVPVWTASGGHLEPRSKSSRVPAAASEASETIVATSQHVQALQAPAEVRPTVPTVTGVAEAAAVAVEAALPFSGPASLTPPNPLADLSQNGDAAATDAVNPLQRARRKLTCRLRDATTWRELRELLATQTHLHNPDLDADHGVDPHLDLDEIHLLTAARRLRALAPQPGRRVAREQAMFRTFVSGFTELCG